MPHIVNEVIRASKSASRYTYRSLRIRRKRLGKKAKLTLFLFIEKTRRKTISFFRRVRSHYSHAKATFIALVLALAFIISLPESLISTNALKASEMHFSSAGIVGTALALILSLSIIPAQKAADVFSPHILKLYAKDMVTIRVFSFLSFSVLASLWLGTNWTLEFSPRYSLAIQFLLLGSSIDSLMKFYSRALSLLVPTTALIRTASSTDTRPLAGAE